MPEGHLPTSSPCRVWLYPQGKTNDIKHLAKLYYFKPTPIKVTEDIKEESELKSYTAFWGQWQFKPNRA